VQSKNISVTYTLTEPPSIALSATSATFTAKLTSPASQFISVTNGGGGTLSGLQVSAPTYTSGGSTGWLTASLGATTAPTTLTLSVNNNGPLPPGTYTATVTVSSTIAGVAPRTVSVTFTRIATMSGDVWKILNSNSCLSCHNNTLARETINLNDSLIAQSALVSKASPSFPTTFTLAIPGDSVNSYLMTILKGRSTKLADNMPPGCTSTGTGCLSASLITIIGIWIQQGALP
jgi:hypothetical protein